METTSFTSGITISNDENARDISSVSDTIPPRSIIENLSNFDLNIDDIINHLCEGDTLSRNHASNLLLQIASVPENHALLIEHGILSAVIRGLQYEENEESFIYHILEVVSWLLSSHDKLLVGSENSRNDVQLESLCIILIRLFAASQSKEQKLLIASNLLILKGNNLSEFDFGGSLVVISECLDHEKANIRYEAAKSLLYSIMASQDPPFLSMIASFFDHSHQSRWTQLITMALNEPDMSVRNCVVATLSYLLNKHPEYISLFLSLKGICIIRPTLEENACVDLRLSSISIVSLMSLYASHQSIIIEADLLPSLFKCLSDEDADVRAHSSFALAHIVAMKGRNRDIVAKYPGLIDRVRMMANEDSDHENRKNAMTILSNICPRPEAMVWIAKINALDYDDDDERLPFPLPPMIHTIRAADNQNEDFRLGPVFGNDNIYGNMFPNLDFDEEALEELEAHDDDSIEARDYPISYYENRHYHDDVQDLVDDEFDVSSLVSDSPVLELSSPSSNPSVDINIDIAIDIDSPPPPLTFSSMLSSPQNDDVPTGSSAVLPQMSIVGQDELQANAIFRNSMFDTNILLSPTLRAPTFPQEWDIQNNSDDDDDNINNNYIERSPRLPSLRFSHIESIFDGGEPLHNPFVANNIPPYPENLLGGDDATRVSTEDERSSDGEDPFREFLSPYTDLTRRISRQRRRERQRNQGIPEELRDIVDEMEFRLGYQRPEDRQEAENLRHLLAELTSVTLEEQQLLWSEEDI